MSTTQSATTGATPVLPAYGATCVQTITRVVDDVARAAEVIQQNLSRALDLVDYTFDDPRYRGRLLVFPEFFLTGVPESRRHEEYLGRAIEIPGPVTEAFGKKAQHYNAYIAGNCFEIDPEWPGRVFNTSWIVGPDGDVILRYRKLNDSQAYLPTSTNPPDLYSAYLERYGVEGLFPVVDTPLGRLACMTCFDVNFPEVARCLALRGAEIILMPTGEGYSFQAKHRLMKQARAYENGCYVITANHGGFIGHRPASQQRGYSEIINYRGDSIACADGPGECTISGLVDLAALRDHRGHVSDHNFLVGLRASLYAPIYADAPTWPLDGWLDQPMTSNTEAVAMGERILQRLYDNDVFARPFSHVPPA